MFDELIEFKIKDGIIIFVNDNNIIFMAYDIKDGYQYMYIDENASEFIESLGIDIYAVRELKDISVDGDISMYFYPQ